MMTMAKYAQRRLQPLCRGENQSNSLRCNGLLASRMILILIMMIMMLMLLMMLIMIINGDYKESIIWSNCLWPHLLRLMAAQWFLWTVLISRTLCLSLVILAFLDKIKTWQSFKLSTLIFYHGDWNRLWLWTSWRLWPWQTIRHQFESTSFTNVPFIPWFAAVI